MDLNEDVLGILACPACKSPVERAGESWLVCAACGRKYPVQDGIPVMLIEVGDKHIDTPVDDLPEPGSL